MQAQRFILFSAIQLYCAPANSNVCHDSLIHWCVPERRSILGWRLKIVIQVSGERLQGGEEKPSGIRVIIIFVVLTITEWPGLGFEMPLCGFWYWIWRVMLYQSATWTALRRIFRLMNGFVCHLLVQCRVIYTWSVVITDYRRFSAGLFRTKRRLSWIAPTLYQRPVMWNTLCSV